MLLRSLQLHCLFAYLLWYRCLVRCSSSNPQFSRLIDILSNQLNALLIIVSLFKDADTIESKGWIRPRTVHNPITRNCSFSSSRTLLFWFLWRTIQKLRPLLLIFWVELEGDLRSTVLRCSDLSVLPSSLKLILL